MDVMLLGMVTDVRPVQLLKALELMDVTLFGIVTDAKPLQPEKAPGLILTVPSCMTILVFSGIVPLYL